MPEDQAITDRAEPHPERRELGLFVLQRSHGPPQAPVVPTLPDDAMRSGRCAGDHGRVHGSARRWQVLHPVVVQLHPVLPEAPETARRQPPPHPRQGAAVEPRHDDEDGQARRSVETGGRGGGWVRTSGARADGERKRRQADQQ